MTQCIPAEKNKYTAQHAAFWRGGVFLYVPQGVEIEQPILSQIWIDAPGAAIFAHTLIIANETSSVRFVNVYTSDFEGKQAALLNDLKAAYDKHAHRGELRNW